MAKSSKAKGGKPASKFYKQARDARTGEFTTLAKAAKRPSVTTVSKRPRGRGG